VRVKRFKAGEVHLPRVGFTKEDQERAVGECSRLQMAIQGGDCGLCNKPLKSKLCWVHCAGGIPLRKWADGEDRRYDPETCCHIYTPRSPDAIRSEYQGMKNEIVHFGCVIKYRNQKWGHAGTTKTFLREYDRVLIERGYSESTPPAEAVADLWRVTMERLEARRLEHLRTAGKKGRESLRKRNPKWGTGARRGEKKYADVERTGPLPAAERNYSVRPFTASESEANLRAAHEEAVSRPETDLERQSREVLELYGVKKPGELSDATIHVTG